MNTGFEINKRSAGVFWTQGDPFEYDAFSSWVLLAQRDGITSICEPYAGSNNLLAFFAKHFPDITSKTSFSSFDISPCSDSENAFLVSPIQEANTLFSIPDAPYDMVITNPPYLARNSARRRHLDFPFDYKGQGIDKPADLYQIALDTCLHAAKWCAMLIPESFITSRYDKRRLIAVISLPGNLFTDTDMPVCLALFGPDDNDGKFNIYAGDGHIIGDYTDIVKKAKRIIGNPDKTMSFNVRDGEIGLRGCDGADEPSIRFCRGNEISPETVKISSRAITRITSPQVRAIAQGTDGDAKIDAIIDYANSLLEQYREETYDIMLTAFKGTRKDGRYRRRLSFDIANAILARSIERSLQ